MHKLLIGLMAAVSLFAGNAFAAGTETNVLITHISTYNTGHIYVLFAAAPTSGPACGTANHGFSFDASTAAGQALAAAVSTALLTGQLIQAVGTGACTTDAAWETLQLVYTE